jgi:hypothetical protein
LNCLSLLGFRMRRARHAGLIHHACSELAREVRDRRIGQGLSLPVDNAAVLAILPFRQCRDDARSDRASPKARLNGASSVADDVTCRLTSKPRIQREYPDQDTTGSTHRRQARTETSRQAVASAHAPGRGTRPNSGPWGIDAILARTAGRLSSSIAGRTALAAGRLSNAVAARTASRAA